MLLMRAAPAATRGMSASGPALTRSFHVAKSTIPGAASVARAASYNSTPLIPKRKIHIGLQGSGDSASRPSNVTAINASHLGPHNLVIGGPGASGVLSEAPFFGAVQTAAGQKQRIDHAFRAIIKARAAGDHAIHLTGHSRGAGNALLLADVLHKQGLIDPDSGEQVAPPGVPVDSLTLLDAVPHMGEGYGTGVSDSGEWVSKAYKDLKVSPNVKMAQHILAGGEKRVAFRQADAPAADSSTQSTHTIIPNARHSDVGGAAGSNEDASKLALSEALTGLVKAGLPFSPDLILPGKEHNQRLERLRKTPPEPGPLEKLIGLLAGSMPRKFPPYAGEITPKKPEN